MQSENFALRTFFLGSRVVTKIYSAMSFNGLSAFSLFLLFQLPRPASWNSFWIIRTLLRFLCPRCNDFSLCMHWDYLFRECLHLFGFALGSVSMQILFLGHRKDLTPCQSMRECLKLTFFAEFRNH